VPEDLEVRSCKRFFLLAVCLQNESKPNTALGNLDLTVYFHTILDTKNWYQEGKRNDLTTVEPGHAPVINPQQQRMELTH